MTYADNHPFSPRYKSAIAETPKRPAPPRRDPTRVRDGAAVTVPAGGSLGAFPKTSATKATRR